MKRKSPKAEEQAAPAIAVAGVPPVTGDAPLRGEAKHRSEWSHGGVSLQRPNLKGGGSGQPAALALAAGWAGGWSAAGFLGAAFLAGGALRAADAPVFRLAFLAGGAELFFLVPF